MILDGVSKLEEALLVEPKKPDTIWCLGTAHTSYAFLTPDQAVATEYFEKATVYFQQAVDEVLFSLKTFHAGVVLYRNVSCE
uniref:Uncharacterized protein MANES_15G160900 n=1 Tax=Rhizophora mucronata TaxID=61149 RepID=A0A2P2J772_RHIMU